MEKEGEFSGREKFSFPQHPPSLTRGRKSYSSRYVDELSFPDTSFVFIFIFSIFTLAELSFNCCLIYFNYFLSRFTTELAHQV